jgi:hypothetical protein
MCLIMQIRFWGPSFESFRALPRTARKHTAFTILLGNAKALRREHRQHVSLFSGSKLATVRVPVHAPALVGAAPSPKQHRPPCSTLLRHARAACRCSLRENVLDRPHLGILNRRGLGLSKRRSMLSRRPLID